MEAYFFCQTKSKKPTDKFELPGVVPYPEEGSEATDHRRPSPRQLESLLMGTKGNCIMLGELIRGLSMGLADIGECERGDVFATRLKR